MASRMRAPVALALCGLALSACEKKSGVSLQRDATIMPHTEDRDGYRFVADGPVRLILRVRQTEEEDRVLQRRFHKGETVGFGYRLSYAYGIDPDRPTMQEVHCSVFLGRIEDGPDFRKDIPTSWPQDTKWPIRFRTSGGLRKTFCDIRSMIPGKEQLLFRLGPHKARSLELWISAESLAGDPKSQTALSSHGPDAATPGEAEGRETE